MSSRSSRRCDSSGLRRTPTPSKQVNLTTVPRKQEDDGRDFGALDWEEHEQLEKARMKQSLKASSESSSGTASSSTLASYSGSDLNQDIDSLSLGDQGGIAAGDTATASFAQSSANASSSTIISDGDGDAEDEGGSSTEEEEEERKAPNQLLMEFLQCLMEEDFENAQKLCKMILIYEPQHPEALKFMPVIEEKLQLIAEQEAESSTEGETDSEDSGGETDEDSNSDDSESSEGESDDVSDGDRKKDSGIASSATD